MDSSKQPRSARLRPRLLVLIAVAFVAAAVPRSRAGASRLADLEGLNALPPVLDAWLERSERTKAEQPHWITPLVTVTPRLEQEIRYDQSWQAQPHGRAQSISGGARLELIPADRIELIFGAPPYIARSHYDAPGRSHGLDNWGDTSFLTKFRLLSANEEAGNYILTLFFGATVPTGPKRLGAGYVQYTPTIAFGKGWGRFDIQDTVGITLPGGDVAHLGMPLSHNTTLQYRIGERVWPELEFNYTWWPNGNRTGQSQLFLTPGVVIGRFPIWKTTGFTIGTGVQVAVTYHRTFDRNWILSARLPF